MELEIQKEPKSPPIEDFALVFEKNDHADMRCIFEENLKKEGLEINKLNGCSYIRAPKEVLWKYAEILKIKLPIQIKITEEKYKKICGCSYLFGLISYDTLPKCLLGAIAPDEKTFPKKGYRIFCEFSEKYKYLFDLSDPNLFDSSTKTTIISFILERTRFQKGDTATNEVGIQNLLKDGIYKDAYPQHEEETVKELEEEWGNVKKWMCLQPLDQIKEYFGPQIGLYYAWLGFYTNMLIQLSVIGIIFLLYGVLTFMANPISNQICNDKKTTHMCPRCDAACDYWELENTCLSSRLNYIIDNNSTVFYAVILCLWSVLYLALWKRYSSRLIYRWGLSDFSQDVEKPRPHYLAKIEKFNKSSNTSSCEDSAKNQNILIKYLPCFRTKQPQKENLNENSKTSASEDPTKNQNISITFTSEDSTKNQNILEPHVSYLRTKLPVHFSTFCIVILFICVSLAAIFGMIIYRMAQKTTHNIIGDKESVLIKVFVLPITAGILDLLVITLLSHSYSYLAVFLTDLEYRRTNLEYDESLAVKNYIFQFVNYYSSLFYIACLKGKFVGYPKKYNRIFGFRQEECNPGGCLMELCTQLVIIMLGKQPFITLSEMIPPYLRKFKTTKVEQKEETENVVKPKDDNLMPWTRQSIYKEYLQMVVQFGFITLFSIAFPLAPLLALINNVFEVRLDAMKMLRNIRRPIGQRVHSIGIWFNIMVILTRISVATTAIIIAFSTSFIPKLIYKTTIGSEDIALVEYLNFTLAYFNTKDFQTPINLNISKYANITTCRYSEFRNPPSDPNPYKRPMIYWKILAARLLFIIIFQYLISFLQAILAWVVPEVPADLRLLIKRENSHLQQLIVDHEKKIAAQEHPQSQGNPNLEENQVKHV